MTALGYTDDIPHPCSIAIQATIASIRADEIHTAIQGHECKSVASRNEAEPGQFLMRLLGLDEWFTVYLLARKSGVQSALQRLREYASILSCMEGDDAYDLQKAIVLARSMEVALTKVAADTEEAKNATEEVPYVIPSITPKPAPSSHAASSILPCVTLNTLFNLCSTADSPQSSEIFTPNLIVDSRCSSSQSNTPIPCSNSPSANTGSPSSGIISSIKDNPFLDLSYLTEEEAAEMNEEIAVVDCSPIPTRAPTVDDNNAGQPYVPVMPPRHIEWEGSKEDGCLWKIKNINNLAPITLEMWQAWGSISDAEVLQCRDRALQSITLSDIAPTFVTQWPMTVFGQPKYKCKLAAGAKVKGKLDTKNSRLGDHKSKLWNWQRPYFRCPCYYKSACRGQLVWLDHAVWFMLNHLECFFTASSIQGRLVMLIKFLSGDARRMVLDHIAFLYIREFLIEATIELVQHPDERFLVQYGNSSGIRMVEALIKPGMFSEKMDGLKDGPAKKRINLNSQPSVPLKRKGMFANHTAPPSLGRRGSSSSHNAPLQRSVPGEGTGRSCSGRPPTHSFEARGSRHIMNSDRGLVDSIFLPRVRWVAFRMVG
ncbi:unnamed protein product [Calypogeia fissa]